MSRAFDDSRDKEREDWRDTRYEHQNQRVPRGCKGTRKNEQHGDRNDADFPGKQLQSMRSNQSAETQAYRTESNHRANPGQGWQWMPWLP
jgi:hypothetical protein